MRAAALTAAHLFFILSLMPGALFAAGAPDVDHLSAGKAALDKGDPPRAIAEFEQVDSRDGLEWLAAALMMEARSPSDAFVERAFAAAMRSRGNRQYQRNELAASARSGDLVVVTLVGERHAFAWAFDRDHLIGYPLPAPADLRAAVERASTYAQRNDADGLARISEDLLPSLLGPGYERVPSLARLIVAADSPLQALPLGRLPLAPSQRPLGEAVETIATGYDGLAAAVRQPPAGPVHTPGASWWVGGSVVMLIAGVAAWRSWRRRRSVA